MSENKKSFGERLQSVPRQVLYLVLVVFGSIPLFVQVEVPTKPANGTIDLFTALMTAPADKPVLIQTDWTNSTRGESAGQFKALMKIIMRRGLKFAMFTVADAQGPEVSRLALQKLNAERKANGEAEYKEWTDYVSMGYFPNAEGTAQSMASNLRNAFASRQSNKPDGTKGPSIESPVLQNVRSMSDVSLFLNITASGTIDIIVERLNGKGAPIALMCTGVMGPQALPYYDSKQLVGISIGLKGVYDLEAMMNYGVNAANGKIKKEGSPVVEGFTGMKNFDQGGAYYPALHSALTLMILAVVAGNVGMIITRKAPKKEAGS